MSPPSSPLRQRLLTQLGVLIRPMTLGVRALVQDPQHRILLVRHTYLPGWYLPGGGVEAGESMASALVREVSEEGGVEVEEPPRLFGIYLNRHVSRRDHVALFVIRRFHLRSGFRPPAGEIADVRFCPPTDLPADTTPATHRRLREVLEGHPAEEDW